MVDVSCPMAVEALGGVRALQGWLATVVLSRTTCAVLHADVSDRADLGCIVERVMNVVGATERGVRPGDVPEDLLAVNVRWGRTGLAVRVLDRDALGVVLVDREENPHGMALAAFHLSRLGEPTEVL